MRTKLLRLVFLVVGLVLAGDAAAKDAELNAIEIVQTYYAAINAGHVDEAMSLVADDALFINPTGTYRGAAEIKASLEGLATAAITFKLANPVRVLGRVVYDYDVLEAGTVIETGSGGLTVVRNGKIAYDGLVATEAPESIVASFYDLQNAGMIDEAMTFVAPDAQFINPTGTYTGADAIKASLLGNVAGGLTFAISGLKDDGGEVSYSYVVYVNGENVETGTGGLTIVRGGRVVFDGTLETKPGN